MNKNFKKESRADLMPIRLTFPVTGPALQTSSPTLFALDHATPATWPLRCFSKMPGACTLFRSIASAIYVIRSRLPPCFVFRCYPLSDPLVDLLNTSYKITYCVCLCPPPLHCLAFLWSTSHHLMACRCLMSLLSVSYTTELCDDSNVYTLLYCPYLVPVLAHNRYFINIYWTNEWLLSEK